MVLFHVTIARGIDTIVIQARLAAIEGRESAIVRLTSYHWRTLPIETLLNR